MSLDRVHNNNNRMPLQGKVFRRKLLNDVIKLSIIVVVFLFLCEYAIYPVILYKCSWPSIDLKKQESVQNGGVLKAMFIADTHLLGPFRGHWFDKLRREWQMHRAFQTAVGLLQPEVIFFLGDLFDEGEWVSTEDFTTYVNRFQELFSVPSHIDVYVVAGNHDIGFHYQTAPLKHFRFRNAFNTSSVRLLRLKEVNFVLVNSMAMEMDGCFLCKEALEELTVIKEELKCQQNPDQCFKKTSLKHDGFDTLSYSSPVLLQHFPMFRSSDSMCTGEDSAPDDEKSIKFRPKLDCLSKESSQMVLQSVKPRLIMSGHTHHYCLRKHNVEGTEVPEYSVPSFSWRNRNDPSFFLGHFSRQQYLLNKCSMPKESVVKLLYLVGAILLGLLIITRLIFIFAKCCSYFRRSMYTCS